MTQAVTVSLQDDLAVVTINNPPVNAISKAVRQGLLDALTQTEAAPAIRAVVLTGAGKAFVAGADIREFGQPPLAPHLPDVILAIENASKPWIAALNGVALGGGLELALGCHYRLASSGAKLGLPEVTLGVIPGAGGTVRLPRLITAENALTMIAGGKPVTAAQALDWGLIDAIEDDVVAAASAFGRGLSPDQPPNPLRLRPANAPVDVAAWTRQIQAIVKKARGQASPVTATKALQNALSEDADTALALERDLFLTLKQDPQSQALRHIFFAERSAARHPAQKRAAPLPLSKIGVVGGGTMGAGIAAACLLSGLSVTLLERDQTALDAGLARVASLLDGSRKRGLITENARWKFQAALSGSIEDTALAEADLIIEAIFEDMEVKKVLFRRLDLVAKPSAILASNTSYLDINEIAAVVADPSRVIGLHFFSPAHVMKLLEIICPEAASDTTLSTGFDLGKRLGKITVPARVCDGFIGNRIMSAYRRECEYMLEDGALPHEIDAAMTEFGFAMGLFAVQDLSGLDISWAMRKRQAASRDPARRYVDIPDRLCEMGRFGRKSGAGWYSYGEVGKPGARDPEVEALILAESARKNITRQSLTTEAIIGRILGAMHSEGTAILDEGIAASPEAIDVVLVNGYGFPRWRGGPMFLKSAKP